MRKSDVFDRHSSDGPLFVIEMIKEDALEMSHIFSRNPADELRRSTRDTIGLLLEATGKGARIELATERLRRAMRAVSLSGCNKCLYENMSAGQLVALARQLLPLMATVDSETQVHIEKTPPGVTRSNYVANILMTLRSLLAPMALRGDILSVVVHGSYSTEDFTEFSDLDVLVIFRDKTFLSRKAIHETREALVGVYAYLKSLDPLCHHGIQALCESDLSAYDESFLPLMQWARASRVIGPFDIAFRLRPCRTESARQLYRHARGICEVPHTPHDVKLILARVLLIPAIFMQCVHGEYVDKKTALHTVSNNFRGESLKAIEMATKMRSTWCSRKPKNTLPDSLIRAMQHLSQFCMDSVHRVLPSLLKLEV